VEYRRESRKWLQGRRLIQQQNEISEKNDGQISFLHLQPIFETAHPNFAAESGR
jgi:hypothetical protein